MLQIPTIDVPGAFAIGLLTGLSREILVWFRNLMGRNKRNTREQVNWYEKVIEICDQIEYTIKIHNSVTNTYEHPKVREKIRDLLFEEMDLEDASRRTDYSIEEWEKIMKTDEFDEIAMEIINENIEDKKQPHIDKFCEKIESHQEELITQFSKRHFKIEDNVEDCLSELVKETIGIQLLESVPDDGPISIESKINDLRRACLEEISKRKGLSGFKFRIKNLMTWRDSESRMD